MIVLTFMEWLGIAIGLAGIIMLNSGGNLSGNPWGVIVFAVILVTLGKYLFPSNQTPSSPRQRDHYSK